MGIIYGLLLIVLGLLAAQDFILQKVPALKKTIDVLNNYAEVIGLVALILGLIWFLHAIGALRYIGVNFIAVLEIWIVSLLTLALGLMFGLPLVTKMLEPAPGFVVKLETWRVRLLVHRRDLGFAAIAFGIITIL